MSEPDTAAKVFKTGDQNQQSAHELLLIQANIRSDEGSQTKQSDHDSLAMSPKKGYRHTTETAQSASQEDQVADGNEQSDRSQDQDSTFQPQEAAQQGKSSQDQDSTCQPQEAAPWGKSSQEIKTQHLTRKKRHNGVSHRKLKNQNSIRQSPRSAKKLSAMSLLRPRSHPIRQSPRSAKRRQWRKPRVAQKLRRRERCPA